MYREVLLDPQDKQLHRFLWRPQPIQPIQDYQMTRVTFGVASSPYLAVRTLQQAAEDFGAQLPQATWHVFHSFYVDDLLGGADSEEEAVKLCEELRGMLRKGGFELRKWRSSSAKVLDSLPKELIEPMPTQDLVDRQAHNYPKALGVAWDSDSDTMATHIELSPTFGITKRAILSDIAKTFDVLGWLSPAILPMKILMQKT